MNLNSLNPMNLLKQEARVNAYSVIPVFFHTDCNHSGQHGTMLVSNRRLGIKEAVVAFFLKNHATAPAFTPKLFLELEAAAESQGYILHELISYDRIVSASSAQKGTTVDRQSMIDQHLRSVQSGTKSYVNAAPLVDYEGVRDDSNGWTMFDPSNRNLGSIRHGEAPPEVGETLLRNAARTEGRGVKFNMHSLNDAAVPAFLRKAAAEAAAGSELIDLQQERARFGNAHSIVWLLNPAEVNAKLADWNEDLREELKTTAALTFSNMVNRGATHPAIAKELASVFAGYTERALPEIAQ